MLARLALSIPLLACMSLIAHAQQDSGQNVVGLGMGKPIDWQVGRLADQYVYTDQKDRNWTVTLKARGKTAEGKPKFLEMSVASEGFRTASTKFDIETSVDYGTLAVYDFDPEQPVFMMTNYTLGAHCCTDVKAIASDGQALTPVDVGSFDGDAISVRDLDGNGTYEIETWDQRFYYAFDSYAASLPARQILKVRKKAEDVTDSPDYQPYLISQINKWLAECESNPSPGICAGVLGTAAKAGLYQSVAAILPFKRIDEANPNADYLNCSAEQCGTEMKFWNYREALEFQLGEWGYNTDSSMSARARDYFQKLAAYRKGFGSPNKESEFGCGLGPVRFTMDKAAQSVELEGYEYSCRIEKANILDKSAVALGLCSAEGETYSTLLTMELDGDTLLMSSIYNGVVSSNDKPEPLSACR